MEEYCKIISDYLIDYQKKHPETNWKLDPSNEEHIISCYQFIENTIKNKCSAGNCVVAEDSYVFGLAVHYFDETETIKNVARAKDDKVYVLTKEDIEICNKEVTEELLEEEKQSELERLRNQAMKQYKDAEKKRLRAEKKAEQEALRKKKLGYEEVSLF